MTYTVWPNASRGEYRVRLEPHAGAARSRPRRPGPTQRAARFGLPLELRVRVSGNPIQPLRVSFERADLIDGTMPRPRLVAARVLALEFIPKAGSRNQ